MLTLNGKKFAKNEKEFIDSLFQNDGTCVGYYKAQKSSIVLLNHKKERIGVINRHGVLCAARKLDKGYLYSFATIKEIGEYKSHMQEHDECHGALNRLACSEL